MSDEHVRFEGVVSYETRFQRRSEARIIVFDAEPFVVVIATELATNPGASVTNSCCELAEHVCTFFGIDPDPVGVCGALLFRQLYAPEWTAGARSGSMGSGEVCGTARIEVSAAYVEQLDG